jgi:hypothetical protein
MFVVNISPKMVNVMLHILNICAVKQKTKHREKYMMLAAFSDLRLNVCKLQILKHSAGSGAGHSLYWKSFC